MKAFPRKALRAPFAACIALSLSLFVITGCGQSANHMAAVNELTGATGARNNSIPIEGHVGGDEWQVRNAAVQMYSIGTAGTASAASPLLTQPVLTDGNGNFKIAEAYSCPSSTSQLYLVATGGTPMPGPATENQAIALMTMLGPCNGLTSSTSYPINEVTTVGSVWPLSSYMASATRLGSKPNDQSLAAALKLVNQLVDVRHAASPGADVPNGEAVQTAKLDTLANDFHACVLSAGGEAGDGSACGQLFALASTPDSPAPTNIIEAALRLAQTNELSPEGLFQMAPGNAPYQPVLTTPPTGWDLKLVAIQAPTNILPITEEISSPTVTAVAFRSAPVQRLAVTPSQVSLSSSQSQQFTASGSGSVRWSISPSVGTISNAGLYTAPASITSAQTITVTATSSSNRSESAQATVSLTAPATTVNVTVSPTSTSLSSSQTQQFKATVTGTSNTAVTWSLNSAVGAVSSSGLYTAPASIASAQTIYITAESSAEPSAYGFAAISLTASGSTGTSGGTGKTYYLAPASGGGSDNNSGLLATAPWLTPNHSLNCGDVVIAAASTAYSSAYFRSGNWGTVSCPAGNNVAWLKCAQFDGCKMTVAGGEPGFYVDKSYWGVQGWEVSANNSSASFCFGAAPNYLTPVTVHHIIFANNVANGCQAGGFTTFNTSTTASEDYIAIIGNIAYNAAQNGSECYSGISIYQPIESDSLAGTHMYIAGNFSYGNVNANPCAGGIPTDGEGVILDTFDGDQGGLKAYAGQTVVENNILVANGGRGLQVGNNSIGSGPFATIYLRHNTVWGNNFDRNQNTNAICGELALFRAFNTTVTSNLAETNEATGCGENSIYAFYVWGGNGTDSVSQNWGYAVSGTTSSGSYNSSGFSFGTSNTFGENAQFANAAAPGAPSCSGSGNVPACMATVIANFKPKVAAAASFGYQTPGSAAYDPLFPQWLCTASVPSGLITMGCQN
jgi:Bacterial Ig-like domain (group 2)